MVRGGGECCVLLLDISFLVFNYFFAIFELCVRDARGLSRPSLLGVNLFLIFIIYLRSRSLSLSPSLPAPALLGI